MYRTKTYINVKTGKLVDMTETTFKLILPHKQKNWKPIENEVKAYPKEFTTPGIGVNSMPKPEDGQRGEFRPGNGGEVGTKRTGEDSGIGSGTSSERVGKRGRKPTEQ